MAVRFNGHYMLFVAIGVLEVKVRSELFQVMPTSSHAADMNDISLAVSCRSGLDIFFKSKENTAKTKIYLVIQKPN